MVELELIGIVVTGVLAAISMGFWSKGVSDANKANLKKRVELTQDEIFQQQLEQHVIAMEVKNKDMLSGLPPAEESKATAQADKAKISGTIADQLPSVPQKQVQSGEKPQQTLPNQNSKPIHGGQTFSMPSLPEAPTIAQRKRAVNEGELEASAVAEAHIEALEVQTGLRLEEEPSDQRMMARKHPRYKAFFEEACSELRARYAPGKSERAVFEGHELPARTAWLAALDAQIKRACLIDQDAGLERDLRTTRHRLAAIYEGLREFGDQADVHAVTRLADDYLPVTIDVFESARGTAVDEEGREAASHLFHEQVSTLCARYAHLGEKIMQAAANKQSTNGRFLKDMAS